MRKKGLKNKIILEHINRNLKEYFITILILAIGIILGVMKINSVDENTQNQVTENINQLVQNVKNNQLDKLVILKNSINKNLLIGILLWFNGLAIIGIPIIYGVILYKGFSLGFTISAMIAVLGKGKGLMLASSSLLIHNIMLFICMAILAVSGINVYKSIVKQKNRESIKLIILKHSIFSVIPILGLLITAFTETYISTYLLQLISNYI